MNTTAKRISPEQAHADLSDNPPALLVCGYDDDAMFEQNHLDGAISMAEFRTREGTLPKDREVIFYCA